MFPEINMTPQNNQCCLFSSNASIREFPTNSLTSFKNVFPSEIYIDEEETSVSLECLSFDTAFSNMPAIVADMSNQIIILKTDAEPHTECSVTLPHRNYTFKSLVELLNANIKIYNMTAVCYMNNKKQLIINALKNTVFIELHTFEWIGFKFDKQKIHQRNGQTYIKIEDEVLTSNRDARNFLLPSYPNMIKVFFNEMKPSLSDNGYKKYIASIPFHKKSEQDSNFHFIPTRSVYHKLNSSYNSHFSFELHDENEKKLNLLTGQPTLIKLTFEDTKMKTFMIHTSSRSSENIYPHNNSASFQAQLNHEIVLDGKWYAALTSISLPSELNIAKYLPLEQFNMVVIDNEARITIVIKLDDEFEGPIYNMNDIIKKFNDQVTEGLGPDVLILQVMNNKVKMVVKKPLILEISEKMAELFGYSSTLDDKMIINLTSPNIITFGKPTIPHVLPHVLFVYASMISPVLIGNKYIKILKMVPLEMIKTEYSAMYYECKHLDYVEVSENVLSTIKIEIRDVSGKLIHFKNDTECHVNIAFIQK